MKPCDKCGRPAIMTKPCPVSLLLRQTVMWNYCDSCYKEDCDLVPIVKSKFSSEEELKEFIDTLK